MPHEMAHNFGSHMNIRRLAREDLEGLGGVLPQSWLAGAAFQLGAPAWSGPAAGLQGPAAWSASAVPDGLSES